MIFVRNSNTAPAPSSNGECMSKQGNMFPDGYGVSVHVFEYADSLGSNWNDARGVA
ncbi:hypothetical protein Pa4123_55220 [Phytohabitans aurantiacus]|uniref:Uncharacterized protein n=1 Tax=Phytohabitans aurantiacus TaxID=3016789 RepID=A0ABQ5R3S9_9ACTN|nr:hypothetical protein Pa4123_55220 [Phytohabitans aurantiacus]